MHNMIKMIAWLLLLAIAPMVSALNFASTRGPYLVRNDTQGMMTMNGIWYSLSNSTSDTNAMDPLKNAEACTRDAALMAQVGINTIYVAAIDTKVNHDDCFSIFNAVGIYVMVVLRQDGVTNMDYKTFAESYTTEVLKGQFEIIDAVKDYDNLLGFNIGLLPTYPVQEGPISYADTMKLYRAFIRDIKSYIAFNAPRPILVGTDLHLLLVDGSERLDPAPETNSHIYYFTCAIDGNSNDLSRSDYVSFYDVGYFETYPVEKQNASYLSLHSMLKNVTVPTWYSQMGIFDEADYVKMELRPDLLMDTLFLFNASTQLIRPNGLFSGGARVAWTNAQIWKPILGWPEVHNWGLTATSPNGDVTLTENYNAYRGIIDQVNPGTWLGGGTPPTATPHSCNANAEEMKNKTVEVYYESSTSIVLATDWALPTRPPGLDALITSGAGGKRGQMVDVTVTTIAHSIRDPKGALVTDVVLKPSSSSKRTTTATDGMRSTASPTPEEPVLRTGAKAGIGVGASVAALALAGAGVLLLLRRRRNKKQAAAAAAAGDEKAQQHAEAGSGSEGFQKAELATGPAVEKHQAELEARDGRTPQEVEGTQSKYELYSPMPQEPVEMPVNEKPVEAPSNGTVR